MDITIELLGAFLTGIVGPILYLLIDRYISKQKDKKKDKIKSFRAFGDLEKFSKIDRGGLDV